MKRALPTSALLAALVFSSGCKTVAVKIAADAVAGTTGDTYARDDDPQLVRDAVPFGLKTMEGVLDEKPNHEGLLTALTSGFTQYGYAFVQTDADVDDLDGKLEQARAERDRARKLYVRARDYGLRGLDVRRKLAGPLRGGGEGARAALAKAEKGDVPLLYWTAAAWALSIAANKGDMSAVSELPTPVAMMERALALDESWADGAIHEFFVTYDASRSVAEGGGPDRAKAHLDRVMAISMNKKLGPRVAYAEGILVQQQNRDEFVRVLQEVVHADAGAVPRYRLANLIAQRRAKALLAHVDDLFL